ncbi:MAG: hypothetical protein ACXABY_21680 [Candidatus Thorarchaeota archaeon]|jgi:hypothetical protein
MPLIANLTELTAGNLDAADFIVAYDASAGTDKKVPADEILEPLLSTFGKTLIDDADAAAFLTTVGITALGQTLLDDANAAAVLTTLGLDADLATLAIPANLTVDSFATGWADDADAATLRSTLGISSPWTYGSQVATTSGNTVTLTTAIPSDCVEVEVHINVQSITASAWVGIDIYGASGHSDSGYKSSDNWGNAASQTENSYTSHFIFASSAGVSGGTLHSGVMRLWKRSSGNDEWFCEYLVGAGTGHCKWGVGWKDVTETLTSIDITTSGTFDAGEARVRYRGL